MTCIIGYLDTKNKRTIMVGDKIGVRSNEAYIMNDDTSKVFINGKFLIGYTTSFRMGQILENMSFPEQTSKQTDIEYMCTTIVDKLIETFSSNNFGESISGVQKNGEFLIAYRDKLYHMFPDFSVGLHQSKYGAVGCGAQYAMGALEYLTQQNENIDEYVLKNVMESVITLDPFVGGGYDVQIMEW
jgi:20S proteasome alpha/beta subunit